MTVHRYLVTDDDAPCECAWMATCAFANWIEGRCTPGRAAAETWLVTCFAEDAEAFLSAAKTAGVTVEEIEGAGDSETYKLLAGAPGSGWADVHGKPPQHVAPEDDCDDEPCGHECDEVCEADGCNHEHCFACGGRGCPGYCDDHQTYNLRPSETGGPPL